MFVFFQSPGNCSESRDYWKTIQENTVISSAKYLNGIVEDLWPVDLELVGSFEFDSGHAWIYDFAKIWHASKVLVNWNTRVMII